MKKTNQSKIINNNNITSDSTTEEIPKKFEIILKKSIENIDDIPITVFILMNLIRKEISRGYGLN